ncbi:hypothetical protein [Aquiflexum balticum]|uniref:hypothetical protein n=1 Tax=Aquiflexum balticum TaxID=280473 RepID=UPI0012F89268|nr:hypothetical protein [Aquiflexum balticum]
MEQPGSEEGYSVLVARYFSYGQKSKEMTYHRIPKEWSGRMDIFTYSERHLRTFEVEEGRLTSYHIYQIDDPSKRIQTHNALMICSSFTVEFPYIYGIHMGIGSNTATLSITSCHNPNPFGGGAGSGSWPSAPIVSPTYTGSGGGSGIGSPSGGGSTGTTPCNNTNHFGSDCIPFPEEQIDLSSLSNCHREIIERLIGSTQQEFKRIFQKFNGNQPVPANYNIKFNYGDCGGGATACTDSRLENGFAIIRINQKGNENATDLSFAKTILHETLHAYLLFEEKFPSNCDLNCLLNKYITKYGPDPNDVHHNLFVETKFLNDIAVELRNFANVSGYNENALGDQFFKDMAWGGLQETDIFKTLPISVQTRIKNRLGAEYYNKNYSGTLPKGIKACD